MERQVLGEQVGGRGVHQVGVGQRPLADPAPDVEAARDEGHQVERGLADAHGEFDRCIETLNFCAEEGKRAYGRVMPPRSALKLFIRI